MHTFSSQIKYKLVENGIKTYPSKTIKGLEVVDSSVGIYKWVKSVLGNVR